MEENKYIETDEITLKQIVLKAKEYFFEVLRNWILVILITLPVVAYMFYKTYKSPTTFPAKLTFMINDDEGGSSGGLMGLAASFGIGGGGTGEYNLEKILSLLRSRNIIQKALFEKVTINEKEDYFANHIILEYDYDAIWEEVNPKVVGFTFKGQNDSVHISKKIENFDRFENSVLKSLHKKVVGGSNGIGMLSSALKEETGIMTLKCNSINEELSIKFLKVVYQKLNEYYISKSTEKQEKNYQFTKDKVDSLRGVLNYSQKRLLKLEDSNQKVLLKQFKAEEARLQFQIQATAMAYGEAMKSKEIADFQLKSKTPFIQTIDTPIPPLEASKTRKTYVKNIILGGILGGFLAVIFILGRKIVRDAMND